jgi:hypothetical protein
MQTLDACDPAGKAGWTALCQKVLPVLFPDNIRDYEQRVAERNRLFWMLDDLDPAGVKALLKRWSEADDRQRWFLLETASVLAWKDSAMLQSVLAMVQGEKPPPRALLGVLWQYFTAMDAAAEPAAAEILFKYYANDIFLSMNDTFLKHLPRAKYLAWLEGIAMGLQDFNARQNVLKAWKTVGPAAKPSLQKISAALAAGGPNLLGGDANRQAEFRKEIENIIGQME